MKSENNHAIRPLAKYIGLSSYLEQVKQSSCHERVGPLIKNAMAQALIFCRNGIKAKGKIVFQNFDYD